MKRIGFLLLMMIVVGQSFAQDFHLSQYWASPLKLNAAQTGLFDGTLRVAASYRNQWFQTKAFSTYAVSADVSLFRNKLEGNVLGFGLGFYQETEGDGAFTNTGANFSLAFNKLLGNKKTQHYLGIGLDFSYFLKQINLKNMVYGNLYEVNSNYDPIDNYNYENKSFADFGISLNYLINFNKRHQVNLGLNVSHILEPNVSFVAVDEDVLYRLFSVNLSSKINIKKDRLDIIPLFFLQNQGSHLEMSMGTYVKLLLNKRQEFAMYLGAQYRLAAHQNSVLASDAVIVGLRAEYKGFDLGLSYDITVSNLGKNNTFFGGPELYLMYILKSKKSKYQKMDCPKF